MRRTFPAAIIKIIPLLKGGDDLHDNNNVTRQTSGLYGLFKDSHRSLKNGRKCLCLRVVVLYVGESILYCKCAIGEIQQRHVIEGDLC